MLLKVAVVGEVRHWCPSARRPHWYKSPYEATSVLLVATCVAPKFRSIQIFPVVGFVTSTTMVAPAQFTVPAGYCGWAAATLTVKEQDCPPTVMAKLAVPLVVGVPVIV